MKSYAELCVLDMMPAQEVFVSNMVLESGSYREA